MRYVKILGGIGTLLMMSACNQPEPLRTVSDFCLNSRVISFEPAPSEAAEDAQPGNQFDTDMTRDEIIAQNAVYRSLCLTPDGS